MPTLETPMTIAMDVIAGVGPRKRLKSLVVSGRDLYSYGPHYPLMISRFRAKDQGYWVNDKPSTATTNRHNRAARAALERMGYRPVRSDNGGTIYVKED
jgi:hypothetical protein